MKSFYLLTLLLTLVTLTPAQDNPAATTTMRQELETVGAVGSVMVDGDICQKIVTPLAKQYMFKVDPRDQWLASDNYDVDDVAFNITQKT